MEIDTVHTTNVIWDWNVIQNQSPISSASCKDVVFNHKTNVPTSDWNETREIISQFTKIALQIKELKMYSTNPKHLCAKEMCATEFGVHT